MRRRVPQPRPTVGGAGSWAEVESWGQGGTKCLFQRGQVARPTQGRSPQGGLGDTLTQSCATLPLPSAEGEEGSGLGQAATLSCPIPSSASQNGFDVCLCLMKPRYASVFMMLAMFLSHLKEGEETVRAPGSFPCEPTGAPKRVLWEAGLIQEPKALNQGVLIPGGSISSFRLGRQEAWPQGLSPIIHAGNWPACPARPQR